MTFDLSAVGATSKPTTISWDSKDCILYALGIGAGTDDLAFTTENTKDVVQVAYPTMAVTLGVDFSVMANLGTIDWTRLVHAEQGVDLFQPLPVQGTATAVTKIANVWDKGKAAVIVTETTATDDASRKKLFTSRSSVYIKGAGGFGGERGPERKATKELGEPENTTTYATTADQALLYRLSGDRNPLHSDPWFAEKAGFERPILHGLCTYGITGRAVLDAAADGDPARIRSFSGRFAHPVMPGDTLHIETWPNVDGTVEFRTRIDDGTTVLTGSAAIS
ncbi:3-hydroxyacyl-thioester dehydratase [Gordonia sp. HNM0687]|uniref:3-hydroxyacyl-thioester dehydratase n=1 Tax=Gordonia mangrovi TaxID=2665643 RepID=A0A6L7GXC1_9ACTN|nr:MaoC/PaaZ C-terminal domain-containing protein [Gordonia mangrovi]MXP24187.1 3-hydroxyacyl-thioester dehydratase [Gordonia mangrovi]UVF76921.1 MaoC/PaaZ C-terminal domain-containing protein [Gordonia mangrovi]